MKPLALAPNLIDQNYKGGSRIGRLRGLEQTSDHQPEEWLAATVSLAGKSGIGLARTIKGDLLRDLVAADPGGWVGPNFAAASSVSDTGILVKLLDAGQRLPVHVHPTRAFASSHLDCPYGKTEAWFILEAEPGTAVYLGWTSDVDRNELDRRRDAQDSEWMLGNMNRVEVEPGMGILVPAGTVHAIDGGVFLAEVQEPTDFSILLEWSATTSSRDESHLGVGFDTVMNTVSSKQTSPAELAELVVRTNLNDRCATPVSLLPSAADPYFRLLHAAPSAEESTLLQASFSVALVLAGSGALVGEDDEIPYSPGQVFAVPAKFGPWKVQGDGNLLVASPGTGWPTTLSGNVR